MSGGAVHNYSNCTARIYSYAHVYCRVYFRHDCLFVEVLNARDVIPLDSNGDDSCMEGFFFSQEENLYILCQA